MREYELKPCPFCGADPRKVYKSSGQTTHIECPKCRAQFPKSTNENAFDEAWNRRMPMAVSAHTAALESLARDLAGFGFGIAHLANVDDEEHRELSRRMAELGIEVGANG